MFYCRFLMMKNKRYKCTHIWDVNEGDIFFTLAGIVDVVYLPTNIKPPLGFCKRPHKYLAKEAA